MKIFKKASLWFLIVVLLFSVVGCGNKNETQDTSMDDNAGTQDEQKEPTVDLSGTTINVVTTSSDMYRPLFEKFEKDTGVKIEYLDLSSGEVLSRTRAEGGKPMADLWFSGGIDAFMTAKDEGLLEHYTPKNSEELYEEYRDEDGYWYAKGLNIIAFIVNNDILEEKKLPAPTSWAELTNPIYKDEIMAANPAISGNAFAMVAGILEYMGEEEGWKYFEELDKNIPYYGKRGRDPYNMTVQGEVAMGITYINKSILQLTEEHNVSIIYPEETIPWIAEGVAIFKNSRNLEGAKAFMDWVFADENLQILAELDQKDTAMMVKPGIKAFDLGAPTDRFVEQDLSVFGEKREGILEKWLELVGDK